MTINVKNLDKSGDYRFIISKVLSFDYYRDGGSVSMSYSVLGNNVIFELLLPIFQSKIFNKSILENTYANPIITIFIPTMYRYGIEGNEIPDTLKYTVNSNWTEAAYILDKAKNIIPDKKPNSINIYDDMISIINNHFAKHGDSFGALSDL